MSRGFYQMSRFLDEVSDFRRAVVMQEVCVRGMSKRRRRYRVALRKRVRILEGRILGW
jgi:hypothetical protein